MARVKRTHKFDDSNESGNVGHKLVAALSNTHLIDAEVEITEGGGDEDKNKKIDGYIHTFDDSYEEITKSLQEALLIFGKKMNGYFSNEAILHATESRTSSPVKIPRNKNSLEHIQINGLYPCGEGAGYAGGIMSAAIDGQKCAQKIAEKYRTTQ